MTSDNVALIVWGYGLVALSYTAFSVWLIRVRSVGMDLPQLAVWLAVTVGALWGWFGIGYLLTGQTVFLWLSLYSEQIRYGCWYGFFLTLIQGYQRQGVVSALRWLTPFAISLITLSGVTLALHIFNINVMGDTSRLILFFSVAFPVFALVLLEQVVRNVTEDSRWNIKPLCLGLSASFLLDLYLNSQAAMFNRMESDAIVVRGFLNTLILPLLLLSMARRNDWISKIQLSPKAAFHSATLLIAGIYLIFISGVGYYVRHFGGNWGRALQLAVIFSALLLFLIVAASGSVRASMRILLGKHFFRYRFDYREEWLKFTHTLSLKKTPKEMEYQVIRGLADLLESPAGSLWIRSESSLNFAQAEIWNMAKVSEIENSNSNFCQFMARSGRVFDLDEYRSSPIRYTGIDLPGWLIGSTQAWLLVPLVCTSDLIGFVVLERARVKVEVNWEVNDLLITAGQQAASFLAHMRAAEALLEVRKFDAFNRMSTFVVHDLKNVIAQLSLMMKNAKRLSHNPDFQQDMLMTIENSLERMRHLMLQLREGAAPSSSLGVDLSEVVQRIEAVVSGRGQMLELQVLAPVVALGHEERLERIIGHVVQNAFDATDEGGHVWLQLNRSRNHAHIVIGDTGHGMTPEFVRDRLFRPFQTTKAAGMGIGAYESLQYVRELGGHIEVDSAVGQGTTVAIHLPLFDQRTESGLDLLEFSA